MALEYQPKYKRDIARPKTKWTDQQHRQDRVFTRKEPGVLRLFTFMMGMMMMMMMMIDSIYIQICLVLN
jgi:hypothetical protein